MAAIYGFGGIENDVRRRGGENIAAGCSIRHAFANETVVDGFVAGPASDEKGDFIVGDISEGDRSGANLLNGTIVVVDKTDAA